MSNKDIDSHNDELSDDQEDDNNSVMSPFPVYSRRELMRMTLPERQALAVHIYGESDPDIDDNLLISRIFTFQLWENVNVTLDIDGALFNQEVMIRYYWMLYHKINNSFPEGNDENQIHLLESICQD